MKSYFIYNKKKKKLTILIKRSIIIIRSCDVRATGRSSEIGSTMIL